MKRIFRKKNNFARPLFGLVIILFLITTLSFSIQNNPTFNIELIVRNANCGQSNGQVELVIIGDSLSYSTIWSNGAVDTNLIDNLTQGTYSVTVSDGVEDIVGAAVVSYERELQIDWTRNYGGSAWEHAEDIQSTPDGGYLIAGYSKSSDNDVTVNYGNYDFWIVKTAVNGELEWERNYGGSGNDQARSVLVLTDSTYLVGGFTNSTDFDANANTGGQKAWLLHLDQNGDILTPILYETNLINDIKHTTNGDFIIAGESGDFWIAKISIDGSIIWEKNYGGTGSDKANVVVPTQDNGYLIAGSSTSDDLDLDGNQGLTDYWILKLTDEGEKEWQRNFGGSSFEIAYDALQTFDGNYVIVGGASSIDGDVTGNIGGGGTYDYWVIKLNESGDLIWEQNYGGIGDDLAFSIIENADGDYIIAGNALTLGGDINEFIGKDDFWIIKLDESGALEGEKGYGGSKSEFARSIQSTTDGGYIVAGYSESDDGDVPESFGTGNISRDFWVVKYDPFHFATFLHTPSIFCGGEKTDIWISVCGNEMPYQVAWNTDDIDVDTLFDVEFGNYEVTITADGFDEIMSSNLIYDIDPIVLWEENYSGQSFYYENVFGATADSGYIMANALIPNGDADIQVIKTNANGEVEWSETYIDNNIARPAYILQTEEGGYIVVGYSNMFGHEDFWVLKIDALGVLEWSENYGGSLDERATQVQQMVDGGYLIAGKSRSNDIDIISGNYGEDDVWVIKINAEGVLQWEQNYGGSLTDRVQSIEATSDGGYVLACESNSSDFDISENKGGMDYWFFKINANGTLLWEQSYGGRNRQRPNGFRVTTDGGFIAVGFSEESDNDVSENHGFQDFWIVKLNSEGILEWEKSYGGSRYDQAFSVEELEEGGYIIVGFSQSDDGDVSENNGNSDYWIIQIDATGNLLWQQSYGTFYEDRAYGILPNKNGSFTIIGNQGIDFSTAMMSIILPYIPSLDLGGNMLYCPDEPITLNAFDPFCESCSYLWSDGTMDSIRTVFPTQSSTYQVTITNDENGCTQTDAITIGSLPPAFDLGPNIELPQGSTTTIGVENPDWIYSWSTGDTDPIIEISEGGFYLVTITNAEGCIGIDGLFVDIISNTTDLKKAIMFDIYPNPAHDQLYIRTDNPSSEAINLSLFDITGKLLDTKTLPPNNDLWRYEVTRFSKGMYLLMLEGEEGRVVKRVVIGE